MSICNKGKRINECYIARLTGCPNCNDYLNKKGEPKHLTEGNYKKEGSG